MRFAAFLFATSLLTICAASLTSKASGPAERGGRIVASVDAKGGRVSVVEHLRDDGNLSLLIDAPNGKQLRADNLIAALDRDEDDVSSYGVTARAAGESAFLISSVKDWGTSTWSYGYTVSFRDGGYHLAKFDYKLSSTKRKGSCTLDLAKGAAIVNGHAATFDPPAGQLDSLDGADLERLCQRLGMN